MTFARQPELNCLPNLIDAIQISQYLTKNPIHPTSEQKKAFDSMFFFALKCWIEDEFSHRSRLPFVVIVI